MARGPKPSVRYWKSRKAFGCWIGPNQHILARGANDAPKGPVYLEALTKFKKLLSMETGKGTNQYLVSSLLNRYRIHLKATRTSSIPGVFEIMARGFGKEYGSLRVAELKPHMLEQWLQRQDHRWNSTSKAHAGQLLLAAVAWAAKKGFIKYDPLRGKVDLPTPVFRGREARMSEELMDLLINESYQNKMRSREFGDLLTILRMTGARPIEIRRAEVFNYENGKLVFRWNANKGYIWKNAKKSQRDRIIFMTPELQNHVEKLVAFAKTKPVLQSPKGQSGKVREDKDPKTGKTKPKPPPTHPIFRTPRGQAWTHTSLCNKWQWVLKRPAVIEYCKKHGVDMKELKLYNFRHEFLSHWVDSGGDIYVAAQLCGTSVKMVEKRYGHPNIDRLHDKFLAYHATKVQFQA